jgi:SagB-type dehydrogenase family enzyme
VNAREYLTAPATLLDELYHTNSKHSAVRVSFATSVQMAERDRILHSMYKETKGRYKTYNSCGAVELPRDLLALSSPLDAALLARRSHRTFGRDPLTLAEIATLLARSYGVSGARQGMVARPVPSGGGLYPLDLYVLQFAGGVLAEGVYHYHVGAHALQRVTGECDRERVAAASIYPDIINGAATMLVVAADMKRVRVKYGERAYRLALLEAGHASQNLYLIATTLGLGIVALDGFYDDRVHALLDIDGVCEIALLAFAIGNVP